MIYKEKSELTCLAHFKSELYSAQTDLFWKNFFSWVLAARNSTLRCPGKSSSVDRPPYFLGSNLYEPCRSAYGGKYPVPPISEHSRGCPNLMKLLYPLRGRGFRVLGRNYWILRSPIFPTINQQVTDRIILHEIRSMLEMCGTSGDQRTVSVDSLGTTLGTAHRASIR